MHKRLSQNRLCLMCFIAAVEVEIWAYEWYKILVPSFL